ncbi:MAG: Fic family protein, partial [Acidobacteria bacterium]|nr:Fic family protein [Acidobacteriota bacterium]
HNALALLNSLFKNPVVDRKKAKEILNLSPKAATDLINIFHERGYLKEMTGNERYQVFLFEPYVNLFE